MRIYLGGNFKFWPFILDLEVRLKIKLLRAFLWNIALFLASLIKRLFPCVLCFRL